MAETLTRHGERPNWCAQSSTTTSCSLQRDWAAKSTYDAVLDIVKTHCGAYGAGVEHVTTMLYKAPPTSFPEYVVPRGGASSK